MVVLTEDDSMELRWVGVVVYVEDIALQNQFVQNLRPIEIDGVEGYPG